MLAKLKSKLSSLKISSLARSVRRQHLTYLSINKLQRLEKALESVNKAKVDGDFVEFGVALGGSGVLIARAARKAGRTFHGLDVFGMIPPPTSDKDDEGSKARYRTIAEGASTGIGGEEYYGYRADLLSDVKAAFARNDVPVDGTSVQLHQGLFESTWPAVGAPALAFAHIDCDWYDPVKYCLNAVADLASPGALILIDDYHDYGGCRTAVDEFLGERPDFQMMAGENPILRKC